MLDMNNPKPIKVSDMDLSWGADRVWDLLPKSDDIPIEFYRMHGTWCELVHNWFFYGLDASKLVPKPGIDKDMALRHCEAIMKSWAPKHEHKIGGVALLLSKWFEVVK